MNKAMVLLGCMVTMGSFGYGMLLQGEGGLSAVQDYLLESDVQGRVMAIPPTDLEEFRACFHGARHLDLLQHYMQEGKDHYVYLVLILSPGIDIFSVDESGRSLLHNATQALNPLGAVMLLQYVYNQAEQSRAGAGMQSLQGFLSLSSRTGLRANGLLRSCPAEEDEAFFKHQILGDMLKNDVHARRYILAFEGLSFVSVSAVALTDSSQASAAWLGAPSFEKFLQRNFPDQLKIMKDEVDIPSLQSDLPAVTPRGRRQQQSAAFEPPYFGPGAAARAEARGVVSSVTSPPQQQLTPRRKPGAGVRLEQLPGPAITPPRTSRRSSPSSTSSTPPKRSPQRSPQTHSLQVSQGNATPRNVSLAAVPPMLPPSRATVRPGNP